MKIFVATALLLSVAVTAAAQTPAQERVAVFADVGYARTADDEGLLGSGAALSAGAGIRLTTRLTLRGVFDRIPYHDSGRASME